MAERLFGFALAVLVGVGVGAGVGGGVVAAGVDGGVEGGGALAGVEAPEPEASPSVWVSMLLGEGMALRDVQSRRPVFLAAIRDEAAIEWAERQLGSDDPGVFRLAANLLAAHRRDDGELHAALLDIARDKERPERVRTFALIALHSFGHFEEFVAHESSAAYSELVTFEDRADYLERRFARLPIKSASERAAISRSLVVDSIETMRLASEEGEITDLRTLETEIVRIRYGMAFLRTEVSDPVKSARGLVGVLEAVSDIPADERFFDRFVADIYVHTLFGLYAAAGEVVPIDSDAHDRGDREARKGYVDRVLAAWDEGYAGGDCALEWHMLSLARGGCIDAEIEGCGIGVSLPLMKVLHSGEPFAAFSAGVVLDALGLIDGGAGKAPRWVVFGVRDAVAEEAVFDLWRSIAAGQLAASIAAGETVARDVAGSGRWVAGGRCGEECGACEGRLSRARYWRR